MRPCVSEREEKAIVHVARDDSIIDNIVRRGQESTGECHMGSATRRQER